MKSNSLNHSMQHEESKTPNLAIWKHALAFQLHYHVDLLPLFPLLFIPIWTDCLHAVLVRQALTNEGTIHPLKAIRETLAILPSFASTKLKLFLVAYLWGLIPIIGWYKDLRYRLKWAMASNVHVFERSASNSSPRRYDDLADLVIEKKKTHALLAVPNLFLAGLFVVVLITTSVLHNSLFFWISGFVAAWIIFPGSATVNTFVYLSITEHSGLEELIY